MRSLREASCEARRFRSVKLSGGERQRVAIAPAILAARPVLILEEGTHQELAGRPDGCYRRLCDTQPAPLPATQWSSNLADAVICFDQD